MYIYLFVSEYVSNVLSKSSAYIHFSKYKLFSFYPLPRILGSNYKYPKSTIISGKSSSSMEVIIIQNNNNNYKLLGSVLSFYPLPGILEANYKYPKSLF